LSIKKGDFGRVERLGIFKIGIGRFKVGRDSTFACGIKEEFREINPCLDLGKKTVSAR
jgi:hypothetical protein